MSADPIRSLILSGGGGRGAFHAGVYKYLMQKEKRNLDLEHAGSWDPHIIVGTSIGAVNGAAIAQGMSADQLVEVWKSLEEKDIQGLPPGMRGLARWAARTIFGEVLDARIPQVEPKMPHLRSQKSIGRLCLCSQTGSPKGWWGTGSICWIPVLCGR